MYNSKSKPRVFDEIRLTLGLEKVDKSRGENNNILAWANIGRLPTEYWVEIHALSQLHRWVC